MSHPANPAVLDAVEALSIARPFTPDAVARSLGVALTPRPELSNAHFAVHVGRGDGASPFAEVELRQPIAPGADGLVAVISKRLALG